MQNLFTPPHRPGCSVVKTIAKISATFFLQKVVVYTKEYQTIAIFRQISLISDIIQVRPRLLWNANRKSYVIYRMMPFSMTLSDSNPDFKGTSLFDVECLRNGTKDMVTMEY